MQAQDRGVGVRGRWVGGYVVAAADGCCVYLGRELFWRKKKRERELVEG
jgi:hypothetical protein